MTHRPHVKVGKDAEEEDEEVMETIASDLSHWGGIFLAGVQ